MTPELFNKKFKTARTKKQTNWEERYRNVMELFAPQREDFYRSVPGEKKGRRVYSSAPYIALEKAANNIHSSLTPHQKKWINLKPGRLVPKDQKRKAEEDLNEIKNTLFDHIFASNFDLAASEFYKDLVVGTACLHIGSGPNEPLVFTTVPLHELYILPGPLGTVSTVFRCYKMSVENIKETWPDANITDELESHSNSNPDKEFELIEGTCPEDIEVYDPKVDKMVRRRGYGYYVMLKKKSEFIVERKMQYSPWVVSRWSLLSGETWGRGLAIIAQDDAETLNEFVRLHIQSMQINTFPMYTVVDDGIINIQNIRVGPGKIIPVSSNGGAFGPTLQPVPNSGNLQAGQLELQRLEGSINDIMYTEPLGPINLPVRSATEVSIRQQDLAKRIGSAFGRLQYEFIKPLINACLNELERQGVIDMNSFRVDGQNIAIEAVSPLALSQQQDELSNVTRFAETALALFGPEIALQFIRPDNIIEFMAENLNVPANVKAEGGDKMQAQQQVMQFIQGLANVQGQQGASPPVQAGPPQ